eukprot:694628-Rhodomonas_salina.1
MLLPGDDDDHTLSIFELEKGTELPSILRTCYAMSGNDVGFDPSVLLWCYALATRCPVLKWAMLLRDVRY